MKRKLHWIGQAKKVLELELPPDFADPNRPDLFSVKWEAIKTSASVQDTDDVGDPLVRPKRPTIVRVYFIADEHRIVGYLITASYDGGYTFDDPLTRYPPPTQPGNQVPP